MIYDELCEKLVALGWLSKTHADHRSNLNATFAGLPVRVAVDLSYNSAYLDLVHHVDLWKPSHYLTLSCSQDQAIQGLTALGLDVILYESGRHGNVQEILRELL